MVPAGARDRHRGAQRPGRRPPYAASSISERSRRSLDDLIARHASLRTTIGAFDGRPVPTVLAPSPRCPSSSTTCAPSRIRTIGSTRSSPRRRTAPSISSPTSRCSCGWCALGDRRDHVLSVVMHHVGVRRLVVQGLLPTTSARSTPPRREGRPPALATLPVDYVDYAAWQRSWVGGRQARTPTRLLAQAARPARCPSVRSRPTSSARPAARSTAARSIGRCRPHGRGRSRARRRRGSGVTLFMVMLAAFDVAARPAHRRRRRHRRHAGRRSGAARARGHDRRCSSTRSCCAPTSPATRPSRARRAGP